MDKEKKIGERITKDEKTRGSEEGGKGSINAGIGLEPVPSNSVRHQTTVADFGRTSSFNETVRRGEQTRAYAVDAGCDFAVDELQHTGLSSHRATRNTYPVVKTSGKESRKR